MVKVTVNDGPELEAVPIRGKIFFTNRKNIYFWSGAYVNYNLTGNNQISLPIRRLSEVVSLEVV